MATCTSLNNLCPQCSQLLHSINNNRADRIPEEYLIRDDPAVYPVIFYFHTRMNPFEPRTAQDPAEEVEADFHPALGREIKVHRAISPRTLDGYVTFWYMVDFPIKGIVDQRTMDGLFSGIRLNVRDWKVKIPTEGQCTSFARLWFFRDHRDYVEELVADPEREEFGRAVVID